MCYCPKNLQDIYTRNFRYYKIAKHLCDEEETVAVKANRKKYSLSTLLVMIPILYFNSCTMGFIKDQSFVLPVVILVTIAWLLMYICEKGTVEISAMVTLIPILAVIMFLLVLNFFNLSNNISTINTTLQNSIYILVFMLVFIAYSGDEYEKDRSAIVGVWCFDTVASCVYTIYRLELNPLLSRYMSTGSFYEYTDSATLRGVISFGGVYGLVLVSVALLAIAYRRKTKKINCIFLMIIYCALIIRAQFMISIVLLFAGLMYVVVINHFNKQNKIYGLIVLIVGGSLLSLFLPDLLLWIIRTDFFGEALNQRLEEIRLLLTGGQLSAETDMILRLEKYLASLSAFGKSLGLGALWDKSVTAGGHSEILDGFANYGLIFIVFIIAIISFRKYIDSKLSGESLKIYKIVFGIYIMMSLLNTSTWAPMMLVLFVVIPFMCLNEINDENSLYKE